MKKFLPAALMIFCLMQTSSLFSQDLDDNLNKQNYFGIGLGAEELMFNSETNSQAYRDHTPRFNASLEWGNQYLALPFYYSVVHSLHKFSIKPRFQFMMRPFADMPQFSVSPGVGASFSYYYKDVQEVAGIHILEPGLNASLMFRYQMGEGFIGITPIMFDLTYWRYLIVSTGIPNASYTKSNTAFTGWYSALLWFGLVF